jgi:hypothetical protein
MARIKEGNWNKAPRGWTTQQATVYALDSNGTVDAVLVDGRMVREAR